jgi:predicted nucleotidyltransferase
MSHKSSFKSIKDFLQKNKEQLTKNFGIKNIGIFGSFATRDAKESSDIDILVEFKDGYETFKNYMGLKFFLEDNFGRKVDLVITETLKPMIKEDILREVVYV